MSLVSVTHVASLIFPVYVVSVVSVCVSGVRYACRVPDVLGVRSIFSVPGVRLCLWCPLRM